MNFEEQKFQCNMESALEKMQRQKSKIADLVSEEKMSSQRVKYAEAVVALDFCLREAKGLVALDRLDDVAQSFAKGRRFLDTIAHYAVELGNENIYRISKKRYDNALNSIWDDSSSQGQEAFAA